MHSFTKPRFNTSFKKITANIATINTGIIAIVANTPIIFDLNFEPAVFFLILKINLLIQIKLEKVKVKKDKRPKKKKYPNDFRIAICCVMYRIKNSYC